MTAGGRSSTSSSPQHMRYSVAARLPAVHRVGVAGRLNDAPDVPVEGRELYRPAQRPAEPASGEARRENTRVVNTTSPSRCRETTKDSSPLSGCPGRLP